VVKSEMDAQTQYIKKVASDETYNTRPPFYFESMHYNNICNITHEELIVIFTKSTFIFAYKNNIENS
jgi:hypothetical protein